MNFKIIVMSISFTIAAKEMTAREQEIVAFMERPADSFKCGDFNEFDMKQAYLLSVVGWSALGTPNFIKKMRKYVKSFDEVLKFRQFMDDKVPHNPPGLFTHNDDGTGYSVKRFCNEKCQYVMSEHSYLPGVIIIEERNTGAILTVRKEVVYPKILFGKS